MYHWPKSEERLNRYARLLQGDRLTLHVYYWGVVQNLASNVVHKHSFFEICYVNGGSGIYVEGDAEYPLYEGVMFCSRPNQSHQIKDVNDLDILFVAFEPDEIHSNTDDFQLYCSSLNTGAIWVEMTVHSPTVQIWKSLLIPSESSSAVPISLLPQLAHALIVSFSSLLGRTGKRPEAVPLASNAALLINRAKLYIRDNLRSNLTLAEVARYINISERHLSRLFAQSIHESFSSLVRNERIRAAEQMLAHTLDPIKDIAERSGFSSVHYFTRIFAGEKGIPPAAFREASRRLRSGTDQ